MISIEIDGFLFEIPQPFTGSLNIRLAAADNTAWTLDAQTMELQSWDMFQPFPMTVEEWEEEKGHISFSLIARQLLEQVGSIIEFPQAFYKATGWIKDMKLFGKLADDIGVLRRLSNIVDRPLHRFDVEDAVNIQRSVNTTSDLTLFEEGDRWGLRWDGVKIYASPQKGRMLLIWRLEFIQPTMRQVHLLPVIAGYSPNGEVCELPSSSRILSWLGIEEKTLSLTSRVKETERGWEYE